MKGIGFPQVGGGGGVTGVSERRGAEGVLLGGTPSSPDRHICLEGKRGGFAESWGWSWEHRKDKLFFK